jgi:hypothetical protein
MTTDDRYQASYAALRSRQNYNEVFTAAVEKTGIDYQKLRQVKSCLAFGVGKGPYEIEFILDCMPQLETLIAVEPDSEAAKEFKLNVQRQLPKVKVEVHETKMQDFEGGVGRQAVDAVLMFQVLYYLKPQERPDFFRKLREQWIVDGGFVIIKHSSRTKEPQNCIYIYEYLNSERALEPYEDIEKDMLEVGFKADYVREYNFKTDFSDPDEVFMSFYQYHVGENISLNDVRKAIRELYNDSVTDQCFITIAVFVN